MSRCLALIALLLAVSSAQAQKAEEMGTPEQRQACSHDVGRYCKMVKPEEGPFAYLACLQKNREKLRQYVMKYVLTGGGN